MTNLTRDDAAGMTVNERLFAAGLLDMFDEAVAHRDEVQVRFLLSGLFLQQSEVEAIVKQVFDTPRQP